jgi:metal-sulfur cluster biosynthetic enzyme
MTPAVTRRRVLEILDGVVDPCSKTAGLPAGLLDMGLVRSVVVDRTPAGAQVSVTLGLTNGLCMLGAVLAREARERLAELPGVSGAEVSVDTSHVWREADMSPEYRARLAAHRAARRLHR